MKQIVPIFFLIIMSGCGTLPKGDKVLNKIIKENELKDNNYDSISAEMGRPKYIKAYAYPRMISKHHILKEGKVLIFTGREKLDMEKFVK